MTNAELIAALRLYAEESPEAKLLNAAADALEAEEQQIAELKDYINYLWGLLDALREEFKKMRGEHDEQ